MGAGALLLVGLGLFWLAGQMGYQPQIDDLAAKFQQSNNRTTDRNTRRTAPAPTRTATSATGSRQLATSGDFSYFSLALSWSPTYCQTSGRGRNDQQCTGQRPYAFVLHGLWPQHTKGWPENCRTGQKHYVPNNVIRSIIDIMPSRGLIIHEYKKHGTCSGLAPNDYFSLSRSLYNKVRVPPRYVRPQKAFQISPRELENDFLRANPQMMADMISVVCGKSGRLKEIRICFAKDGTLTRCGRNEEQRRLCSRNQIRVPPVRGKKRS